MAYEIYEALNDAGDLLKKLSGAAQPDSEGGAKIEMGELLPILAEIGLQVVGNVQDDEPTE